MLSKELSKFLEPMVILTSLISILYFQGWVYTLSYFDRLGIKHECLNLSAIYYLTSASYIVYLTIMCFSLALYYHYKFKLNLEPYIHDTRIIVLIIFMLILFLSLPNAFIGHMHAKYLIEGERDIFSVNFSWKEDSPKEMEGKELIFIIYNENKYYVIAKQKPAPKNPEIYIIPDDQIKFVLMKKNNPSPLWFISNLTL